LKSHFCNADLHMTILLPHAYATFSIASATLIPAVVAQPSRPRLSSMSLRSFPNSSDNELLPVSDNLSLVRLERWLRSGNRNERDLSTHSAPASSMDFSYYGGAKVMGIRLADLETAPLFVLSDAQLERRQSEVDHPCKRRAKSIVISVDCNRILAGCCTGTSTQELHTAFNADRSDVSATASCMPQSVLVSCNCARLLSCFLDHSCLPQSDLVTVPLFPIHMIHLQRLGRVL
jgi:WD40 repeat protein